MLELKFIHVATVLISIVLFSLRAFSKMCGGELYKTRIFRVAPHINDTLLLVSALALMIVLGRYPFVESWLTVKVLLLLAYILLGMVFMKLAKTRKQQIVWYSAALLCYLFIISVAVTQSPLGIVSKLG